VHRATPASAKAGSAYTILPFSVLAHAMPELRFDDFLAFHRAGRFAEAERGYRECLREGHDRAGFALAVLLLQQQRHAEAADVLLPLALARPDDADVAVNLSLALRHTGRIEESLQAARRARALAPQQLAAWNALGLAAFEAGLIEEALAAFEAGLQVAPRQMALELHRAHCLRRLGRNQEALSGYLQVVQADPQRLDAWRGLARVQSVLGQLDAALLSRERALQLAPDDREILFEHATALLSAGRTAQSAQRLQALLDTDSGDARLWDWLGRARLKQGDLGAARTAFEQAQTHDPDDPTIAHFHASLSGALPEAVEVEYIRRLFDDFADHFDRALVDHLGYAVPERIARLLHAHRADTADRVLDLGCGTGLMGERLAQPGRRIDGVDLSPRMLALARERGMYQALHQDEMTAFLHAASERWGLIVAADVFIYAAALRPVFAAVFDRLEPGGVFAFSIEVSEGDATDLPPVTGRYRHSSARTRSELEQAGFACVAHEPIVLRLESGQPVAGELLLARRPVESR
jgi:predicted TPR repeat methyltransferase